MNSVEKGEDDDERLLNLTDRKAEAKPIAKIESFRNNNVY